MPKFDMLSSKNCLTFLESLIAFDKYVGDFVVNQVNLSTVVGVITVGLHQRCLNTSDLAVGQLA